MNDVKFAYMNWAERYDKDSHHNPATEMDQDLLIPMLETKKKDLILDMGCGTGRFTIPLAKKCKKVTGIDFSEDMLNVAKRKGKSIKNIEFKRFDITKRLPFKNNSFDKIVSALLVNHIKNLKHFITEAHRVLKKGGIFVYDDFAPDFSLPITTKFDDILLKMNKKGFHVFSWHSINDHVYALHRSNFEILEMKLIRIDQKIKHTFTPSAYKKNKGRTLGIIFKAKKL